MQEKRRIRILFMIDYFKSPHGGTEGQLFHILRNLDRSRFQPFLCCLWPTPWMRKNIAPCEKVVLFPEPIAWYSAPFAVARLRNFLRAGRFDIVHTFFPTSNTLGVLAARLASVPGVLSSRRDLGFWETSRDRLLLRAVRNLPTRYVANCYAVKRNVAVSEGIDSSRIVVVHNGIDTDAYGQDFRDQAAILRRKYHVPENGLVVGVIANYQREVKGIKFFVDAARLVASEMENTYFFIVGHGPQEQERALRRRIRELALDPCFVLTGLQQDVRPFLSMFHVGVLPSLSEGFSNTLLEYMAAGLAPVASDVGGNSELVVHRQSGYLVKPASPCALAEKIILLLKDSCLRERMGRNAMQGVKNRFSIGKMIRAMESLYQDVCCPRNCRQ